MGTRLCLFQLDKAHPHIAMVPNILHGHQNIYFCHILFDMCHGLRPQQPVTNVTLVNKATQGKNQDKQPHVLSKSERNHNNG